MAKAWIWVLVVVFAVVALIWFGNYWYNYYTTGICRDDHGNAYFCGKAYRYSNSDYSYPNYNSIGYSYYDNYGNRVVKTYDLNHNFDDYYDCYHAMTPGDRYGELLKEEYGIRCTRNYEVLSDNYYTVNVKNPKNTYVEKAPIIYVK